jgi:hypothetical protein
LSAEPLLGSPFFGFDGDLRQVADALAAVSGQSLL